MSDRQLVRYSNLVWDSARWEGFELRPGDIVIATPPKCGTTWTQMICALLIFQTPTFDQPLSKISPWIDMLTRPRGDVIAELDAQQHRRFIKTHTPLDGLPWSDEVTYINVGRDPRDVAVSMAHHMSNMDYEKFLGALAATASADGGEWQPARPGGGAGAVAADAAPPAPPTDLDVFWEWVDNPIAPTEATSSLLRTLTHHETFWSQRSSPNVVLLHYDELQADLDGQMRALADRLAITAPGDRWPSLVEAATFEKMRGNAGTLAPNTDVAIWQSNTEFFHRGTSGQWRTLLDDEAQHRYRARVEQLGVDPDLRAWIHHEA